MGIGKWVADRVADKMARLMAPRFSSDGATLQVIIDDTVAEDYGEALCRGIAAFDGLIKEVAISKEKLPPEGWNAERRQYNVTGLVQSIRPILRLYLIGGDVFIKSMNWAYGITSPLTGVATVGLARLTNSETALELGLDFTPEATRAALTREVQHEVAHLLGLHDHPEGSHIGSCIMNQTMRIVPPRNFMAMATERAEASTGVFCSGCKSWLEKFRNDVKAGNLKPCAERLLDA